jgi:hypothetical protein
MQPNTLYIHGPQVNGAPLHNWVAANAFYNLDKAKTEILRQALKHIEDTIPEYEEQQRAKQESAEVKELTLQDARVNQDDLLTKEDRSEECHEYTAQEYDDFNKVSLICVCDNRHVSWKLDKPFILQIHAWK